MLNRLTQPALQPLEKIQFVEPHIFDITSEVKLFWMQDVLDETVRIELHFDAGSIRGDEKLAGFVNGLLFSGTPAKTSVQISHELDGLGAFLDQEIGQETAIISLYCLRQHAEKALEIVVDAIQNVHFDETEVSDLLRVRKQQFLVSSEKVNMLARREFQKQLFTNEPNYARQLELADFESINIKSLQRFHKDFYLNGLTKVVVVSNVEQAFIDRLIDAVGGWSKAGTGFYTQEIIHTPGRVHIEKTDAVQTAIRMGIPLFNKTHSDYIDFSVMQTIFGDYFGSRLMSNIREDKGYTYGIGCGHSEAKKTGYFIIATEVGKAVAEATLHEIELEMNRLKEELVPDDELELVKNYMLGQLLKSADGPNAMIDLYLAVQQNGMDFEFYNEAIQRINSISAARIQELAKQYLNWENFTLVTAGSSNEN